MENEKLLKRIQSKKSNMSFKKFQLNEILHKKYLKNICEFPLTLYKESEKKENSISKEKVAGLREQSKLIDGETARSDRKFRITSKNAAKEAIERVIRVSLQKSTLRVMGDVVLADATKETKGEKHKRLIVTFTSMNSDQKFIEIFPLEKCKRSFLRNGLKVSKMNEKWGNEWISLS